MADDTTPADLERQLGIDQRRIRHHLRQRYGTLPAYTDNWHLNARAAEEVRIHFRAEADALRASGVPTPTAFLRDPDTGSIPVLFREATGTTTYDEDGRLRYLPGPDEEQPDRG